MEAEKHAAREKSSKVLGRKRQNELKPAAVKQTKRAYREKFTETINQFGANRGLELEQLVLKDSDGERVVVNAQPPNTFENLNQGERKRLARASRWKDLNRLGYRVYASAGKVAELPPASHIKQHEQMLNAGLDPIHQVTAKFRSANSGKYNGVKLVFSNEPYLK